MNSRQRVADEASGTSQTGPTALPRRKQKGIRWTATSAQVFAKVDGKFVSQRFPLDTPLTRLKAARERLHAKHKHGMADPNEPINESELFPADADKYLSLIRDMVSFVDRQYEITCWSKAFATKRRRDIEGRDIMKVLQQWKVDGIRAHDPRILYRLLARIGRRKWKTRRPENRRTPQRLAKTRARLRLILHTGWPHAQIMRLLPEHINWKAERVRVPGRRKGKGKKAPRVVPVFAGAVTALKAFAAADAWGPFSTSSMHSALARAIKDENAWRAKHKKPALPHIPPYDFRHTALTEMARHITDDRVIQELALHSNPSQTRRYTDSATATRVLTAVDAVKKAVAKDRGTAQK